MYYAVEYPNHAAAFGWSVGMILVGAVFAVVGLGMLIDYRGMSSRYLDIKARIKQSFGLRARLEEDWRGGSHGFVYGIPILLGSLLVLSLGIVILVEVAA